MDDVEYNLIWVEILVGTLDDDEVEVLVVLVDELDDVDDEVLENAKQHEEMLHIIDDDDEEEMFDEIDVNEYLYFVILVIVDII